MPAATLTSKGQLVIPKAVREYLGVRPGDELDFVIQENGEVVVRPATLDVCKLAGMLHNPSRRPVSLRQMEDAIRKGARRSA